MFYRSKPDGKLYFHDEAKKFIDQAHGLANLISDHDICVYSLTPKGHTSPAWLIVKVTVAKCMDRYLDSNASFSKRCVVMFKQDYERYSPKNLFGTVRDLKCIQSVAYKRSVETKVFESKFYERNGIDREPLTTEEFFSIDIDPDSDEEGAKIYLRDKAHFLGKS